MDPNYEPLAPWERDLLNGDAEKAARPNIGFALHITLLMAFDGLRGVVERAGADHKNVGECIYAKADASGVLTAVCIVGQFFADLGILRALTSAWSDGAVPVTSNPIFQADAGNIHDGVVCNIAGLNPQVRSHLADVFGITFDDKAWTFLANAQERQDRRETWGNALEHAAKQTMQRYSINPPEVSAVERLNACFEADIV